MTTLSSREFNQNVTKAKKASLKGPVFITDRGAVSHVLLSIDEYQKIMPEEGSILELLSMPEAADIELESGDFGSQTVRPEDFS